MNIKDSYIHNGEAILKDIQVSGSKLQKLKAGKDANDAYLTWVDVLDLSPFGASGHNHDDRYLKLTGNGTTNPLTGSIYIKDVNGIILNSTNKDLNIWEVYGNAGSWSSQYGFNLQYAGGYSGNNNDLVLWAHNQNGTHVETYRVKQDGTFIFKAAPKVGTNVMYHAGNLSIKTLMGTTAIGDTDEPVYWNGTSFVKAGAYPTKASWNYDDVYLKLSGGLLTGDLRIKFGDTDKFVTWDYDGDNTAGASWRIGAKGTGSGNANYFCIESGTNSTSASTWNNILNIGQNDFTVYFSQTPKVGTNVMYHAGNLIPKTITLSTTAQTYITAGSTDYTIKMPSTDPYTSARTPKAHTHYATTYKDSRDTIMTPTEGVAVNGIAIDFKTKANGVGAGSGSYCGLVTFDPYSDYTGGYPLQIGFNTGIDTDNTNEMYIRTAKDANTWNSWRTVITSGNIGSQSVNKATYASNVGTSGTAGTNYVTASKVISACNWYDTMIGSDSDAIINRWSEIVDFVAGFKETPDLATFLSNNYLAKSGGTMIGKINLPKGKMFQWTSDDNDNNSTGGSWYGITQYVGSDNQQWLNISNYWGINITTRGNSYLQHNGNVIYTSANLPAYPTKDSWNYDDRYLKLSGGTMTGDITMNGMNTNLNWNVDYLGGWARDFIVYNQHNSSSGDLVNVFHLSGYGNTNGFEYAYIGTSSYDGNNLRFNKDGSITIGSGTIWHSNNDGSGSGLDADLLDGYHVNTLYTSIEDWINKVGNTKTVTIGGDKNTYYPVVISATYDKTSVNIISIWKNLGSPTASYPGNHPDGSSSMWLMFEGRSCVWDGNGGYYRTIYKSQPYATLISDATVVYSSVSVLCVYLRGGGTTYNISTTYPASVTVYLSATNIGPSSYPANVTPKTDIGNGGILNGTFYGNCTGNADTVDGYHASSFSLTSHTHPYLPLSGGTMDQGSHVVFPGTSTDTNYGGSIEFREVNYVTTSQTDWSYAPGITFHWGGLTVGKLGLRSDGNLAWRNQSIIHSGNIGSQSVDYANSTGQLSATRYIYGNAFNGTQNVSGNLTLSTGDQINFQDPNNDGVAFNYNNNKSSPSSIRIYNGRYSEIARFTTSGYFGIGTASPSYKLHVSGDSYTTGWSRAASGFYIEGTGVYYTNQGSFGEINIISNNEFLYSTSDGTLYFNYRGASRGTTVTNYIWNAGSSSSYASHTLGYLTSIGNQTLYGLTSTCNSGNSSSYTNAAVQIREYNFGGAQSDTWGNAPRLAWHWSGRVQAQIGLASNNHLYISEDGSFSTPRLILHSGNYNSYALPLSGGTMTGNLSFSNSGTEFRGINYGTMGDNDQWRIGGAATGSNSGYMEIATADDGTEPIYVRQYTGVFSSLTRTLALLDSNGDTTIPGNVGIGTTSPSYKLDVAGNIRMSSHLYASTANMTGAILKVYDEGNNYGQKVVLGSGGTTLIGAGESADVLANYFTDENLYLSADGSINIFTNLDGGWDYRRHVASFSNNGNTYIYGGLYVGSSSSNNYIAFYGNTGDAPGSYATTFIGEHLWGSPESTELLLMKFNDVGNGTDATTVYSSGPDRIRHLAHGHVFQIMTDTSQGDFVTMANSTAVETKFDIARYQLHAYAPLAIISDGTNSGYDGLVYMRHYSNNDWGLIVDKSQSYTYGVDIRAGGEYALKVGNGNTRLIGATIIGADVTPSYTLDVRGTIRSTSTIYVNRAESTTGFFQTSDFRKKNILGNINEYKAYDFVKNCKPVIYELKDDETHDKQLGLIAQEVEEYFPELVITDENGFKSMDYSRLSVVLFALLKDLIKRNKL